MYGTELEAGVPSEQGSLQDTLRVYWLADGRNSIRILKELELYHEAFPYRTTAWRFDQDYLVLELKFQGSCRESIISYGNVGTTRRT